MIKLKNKSKKFTLVNAFICVWILAFIFLGMAFAGFTSTVAVEGKATIESHIFDYVYITSATVDEASDASSVNYSFTDHEVKANISADTCSASDDDNYVKYKLEILNNTDSRAYITETSLASIYNTAGNLTNSYTVQFIDADTNEEVVTNSTYIKPHSTKTIYLKIKYKCGETDTNATITANFNYSLYKYYNLTIDSVPNDASIKLVTQSDGTYTGIGAVSTEVKESDVVSYTVEKDGYYTETNSYTMGGEDHHISVTLSKIVTLTVNSTPSDSNITIETSDGTKYSGTGTLSAPIKQNDTVTYTVERTGYTTQSNTYTIGSENSSIDVELVPKTITLTFVANGSTLSTKSVTYGSAIGNLPTPTNANSNAVFFGWYDSTTSLIHDSTSTEHYSDFPILYYADAYGDLYNAFGYDKTQLYNHYRDYGISEERRTSQYISTDISYFTEDTTLYAGWIYIHYNITIVQDSSDSRKTIYIPGSTYTSYATSESELLSILSTDGQNIYINWTSLPSSQQGQKITSNNVNLYTSHNDYYFIANSSGPIASSSSSDTKTTTQYYNVYKSKSGIWTYSFYLYHFTIQSSYYDATPGTPFIIN